MIRGKAAGLGVAVALAACQTVTTPGLEGPAQPEPAVTPGCDVEVVFGSYAGGADQALRLRVRGLLESERGARFTERPWGREGESTFCVQADAAVADRLYVTIARWIPDSSRQAPTSVAHRDGRRRAAAWPN